LNNNNNLDFFASMGGDALPIPKDGYWIDLSKYKYAGDIYKCSLDTCFVASLQNTSSCWQTSQCSVAAGAYSFMLLLFGSVILNMGDLVSEDSDEEVLIHKLDGGGGGGDEGNMKLPVVPAPPLLKLLIGLDFISNLDVLPFFFVKP
jgi:hypothetical protein